MRIRAPDKGGRPSCQRSTDLPEHRAKAFAFAAALSMASAALAQDVRVDGSYRLRVAGDTNLVLDDAGTRLNQQHWIEHRLRLTPKITEKAEDGTGIEIQAEFDVLSGLIGGQLAPPFQDLGFTERSKRNGFKAEGFDFRHLFAQLRLPVGLVQIGQMPSQWGMGLVANGGGDEEQPDFGDVRFGDIVERLLFATRPFGFLGPRSPIARHVSLALAADLVYRDRYATLLVRNGGGLQFQDTAYQGVGALIWDPVEGTRAGLYVARRVQSFALGGGDLHIWIFDGHLRTGGSVDGLGGAVLSLEAEAAQIYGGTSHAPNLAAPGTSHISQRGAAARGGLARGPFELELEGGYASGDPNPLDADQTGFTFNRDFKVGLVLWDEVMLFQTQNAARRLADPALSGRPPGGIDLIPTEGAVANALYLKPTFRYHPALFGGTLRLTASLLLARAPELVVDPYQAFLTSAPTNSFGHAAGKNYGEELDLAAGYRVKLAAPIGLETGAQLGVLFPGDAFDRKDGSRMPNAFAAKVRATLLF